MMAGEESQNHSEYGVAIGLVIFGSALDIHLSKMYKCLGCKQDVAWHVSMLYNKACW